MDGKMQLTLDMKSNNPHELAVDELASVRFEGDEAIVQVYKYGKRPHREFRVPDEDLKKLKLPYVPKEGIHYDAK